VEIEHVVESHEEESHDGEEESIEGDAPAGEVGEIVEPSVVEQVESVVDDDDSEKKSEPAA
jgi:hypothetical protein